MKESEMAAQYAALNWMFGMAGNIFLSQVAAYMYRFYAYPIIDRA